MKHFLILLSLFGALSAYSQRNSGIFYSTLFSKEGTYLRCDDFGNQAQHLFFNDVNGDGLDDGIAYYHSPTGGKFYVALSDGINLLSPYIGASVNLSDYWKPYMGDMNGDHKSDIICIDSRTSHLWVLYSNGKSFNEPVDIMSLPNIRKAKTCIFRDLNNDNFEDIIWTVDNSNQAEIYLALSSNDGSYNAKSIGKVKKYAQGVLGDVDGDGHYEFLGADEHSIDIYSMQKEQILLKQHTYCPNLDFRQDQIFLEDLDKDGKSELIVWAKTMKCDWLVNYEIKGKELKFQKWIHQHLPHKEKNGINYPQHAFLGSLNGFQSIAMVVSKGMWTGVEFTQRGVVEDPNVLDRYVSWGNDYIPTGGTYDPNDSTVVDRQIRMIHDAGFTYITFDITNGHHEFVDSRAHFIIKRIRHWNAHINSNQHKLFVNIALGITRGLGTLESFYERFEKECERAWNEFYIPYKEFYYKLNGKPLVIHMLDNKGQAMIKQIASYNGSKKYISKLSNRWMDGNQDGTIGKPNSYGWIVPGYEGNEYHKEMMPVMPGFWNGITFWPRRDGMQYKKQWLRVLKYKPESVWINSFNETWEHTSVEPARFIQNNSTAHIGLKPWTDAYGNLYDSYYWDLTYLYNQLYMNDVLKTGTYFQEEGCNDLYRVCQDRFIKVYGAPVMKPVLLLPSNFRNNFKGTIIE